MAATGIGNTAIASGGAVNARPEVGWAPANLYARACEPVRPSWRCQASVPVGQTAISAEACA